MRWWTPARADGLLALVLTAFGQLNLRIHLDGSATYGPAFGSAVATAAATGVLALRRRAPLLTMVSVAAAVAGPELFTRLTFTLWGGFLPLLVAAYSVARHAERRAAWTGLAVAVLCAVVVMLRVPEAGTTANIPFAVIPLASVVHGTVRRTRDVGYGVVRERASMDLLFSEYELPDGSLIYHMDLYRIKNISEAVDVGIEDCLLSNELCFVEWPEIATSLFPAQTIHIKLQTISSYKRKLVAQLP